MIILFINSKIKNITYENGNIVYDKIKTSIHHSYFYYEIDNFIEYSNIINTKNPTTIIYNYDNLNMSWLNELNINKKYVNICINNTDCANNIFDIILDLIKIENYYNEIDRILSQIEKNCLFINHFSSSYFSVFNNHNNGNQTKILRNLFFEYINNNKNILFIVSNKVFEDNYPNKVKKLYINFDIYGKFIEFEFNELEYIHWNIILNKLNDVIFNINIKESIKYTNTNSIEVSIGEIIDKYSILEIKFKYITDNDKLKIIKYEMDLLKKQMRNFENTFFYKLLLNINQKIWDDSNVIKSLNIKDKNFNNILTFAETSNSIFENNQKRFRLKNYFNDFFYSTVNEFKSYKKDNCLIKLSSQKCIYNKIPEINFLCISHDIIYFEKCYQNIINKLFKNPNIFFIENYSVFNEEFSVIYDIDTFSLDKTQRDHYEFEPIKYVSCGKLGDFLLSLSVVCENFYETGKKGIIYLYDKPDDFTFGIKKAYDDLYDILKSQNYIKDFKLYNNENDIDLNITRWKNSFVDFTITLSWYDIFKIHFNIDWAKNKWLYYEKKNNFWSDKIIINFSKFRSINRRSKAFLIDQIQSNLENCYFISNIDEDYDHFLEWIGLNIKFHKINNLNEIIEIINSCKVGYFGFSSSAAIAIALHKQHYLLSNHKDIPLDFKRNNIINTVPYILNVILGIVE
jgi:hypothetical protein